MTPEVSICVTIVAGRRPLRLEIPAPLGDVATMKRFKQRHAKSSVCASGFACESANGGDLFLVLLTAPGSNPASAKPQSNPPFLLTKVFRYREMRIPP